VPIEETAETMHMLLRQGKIRAIGCSNFSVAEMDRFRQVAPLHVVQPPYNMFERGIEADILPYCLQHDITTLGYGALCRGLLSGRMRSGTTFDGDDLRRNDPKFQPPRFGNTSMQWSSSTGLPRTVTASASSISRSAGCWNRVSVSRCGGSPA